MSYWKVAGLTYLQYVNAASTHLRNAVKPGAAAKYLAREEVHYKKQLWTEGKPGERVLITVKPNAAPEKAAGKE